MQQKKTTQEEYQKCVNAVVDYINLHLGEEIDLKSLARIFWVNPSVRSLSGRVPKPLPGCFVTRTCR